MNGMHDVIKRQSYANVYQQQSLPGFGAAVSVPTAIMSGARAIQELFKAYCFPKDSREVRIFENGTMKIYELSHMQNAKDLGRIFRNSMLNIFSFGIWNYCTISQDKLSTAVPAGIKMLPLLQKRSDSFCVTPTVHSIDVRSAEAARLLNGTPIEKPKYDVVEELQKWEQFNRILYHPGCIGAAKKVMESMNANSPFHKTAQSILNTSLKLPNRQS